MKKVLIVLGILMLFGGAVYHITNPSSGDIESSMKNQFNQYESNRGEKLRINDVNCADEGTMILLPCSHNDDATATARQGRRNLVRE